MLQATMLMLVDMVDKELKAMVIEIWSTGFYLVLGVMEIGLHWDF